MDFISYFSATRNKQKLKEGNRTPVSVNNLIQCSDCPISISLLSKVFFFFKWEREWRLSNKYTKEIIRTLNIIVQVATHFPWKHVVTDLCYLYLSLPSLLNKSRM